MKLNLSVVGRVHVYRSDILNSPTSLDEIASPPNRDEFHAKYPHNLGHIAPGPCVKL
jgi:hypothetical protein